VPARLVGGLTAGCGGLFAAPSAAEPQGGVQQGKARAQREMMPNRIAVLSDIHGNVWALDAVLEDISQRNVEHIVNLGDSVYGPLMPGSVAEMIVSRGMITVQGNEDRIIVEDPVQDDRDSTIKFVRERLSDSQLQWLRSLPVTAELGAELFLCHGTPQDDTVYLMNEVGVSGLVPRGVDDIEEMLVGIEATVILCGHDHMQTDVRLPSGRLVLNPGSVGLPAFTDDLPLPHGIAAGSPHARYSILRQSHSGWSAEHLEVEYDWGRAADAAGRHGRADWAHWLRTGLVA
jgi:predicted phosphodiesterase